MMATIPRSDASTHECKRLQELNCFIRYNQTYGFSVNNVMGEPIYIGCEYCPHCGIDLKSTFRYYRVQGFVGNGSMRIVDMIVVTNGVQDAIATVRNLTKSYVPRHEDMRWSAEQVAADWALEILRG